MTDTYATGKPCRNGHVAPRYVIGDRCTECKAAKDRRHYDKRTEEIKARSAAWHAANRERANARNMQYHARNKTNPDYQSTRKAYMTANRERLLEIKRTQSATPEAKALRAAKRKERSAQYRGYEQKRRARLLDAIPKWYGELDEFVMREAAELCEQRGVATGIEWQIDHMVPLLGKQVCGLHCATNVQVIPALLNKRKNNRMILTEPCEWIAHL